MKAEPLRARVVDVLNGWLSREGFPPLDAAHVLDAPDLDCAVARGAAYYGRARATRPRRAHPKRRGAQLLHRHRERAAGRSRASGAAQGALRRALRHGGRHERADSGREFGLAVGEPAEFRFLSSTIRKSDPPGALIDDWGDELEELGPLEVTLDGRRAGGRDRAGHAREPRDRDRHARAVVPGA